MTLIARTTPSPVPPPSHIGTRPPATLVRLGGDEIRCADAARIDGDEHVTLGLPPGMYRIAAEARDGQARRVRLVRASAAFALAGAPIAELELASDTVVLAPAGVAIPGHVQRPALPAGRLVGTAGGVGGPYAIARIGPGIALVRPLEDEHGRRVGVEIDLSGDESGVSRMAVAASA